MKYSYRFYVIMLSFVVVGAILIRIHLGSENRPRTIVAVPEAIGQWTGTEVSLDSSALGLIRPDSYIFRNYRMGEAAINVYLGWYETMDKSDLAHSPLICYHGQGWTVREQSNKQITIKGILALNVQEMIIEKGTQSELVIYWHQTGDFTTGSMGEIRLRLFWQKILGQFEKNCFVRTSISFKGDKKAREHELENFIKEFSPKINELFSR